MNDSCIHIDRISAGWIDGTIHDEHTVVIFSNSYLENFLDDFMLAILTVLGEYPADEHKNTFRAEMEPIIAKWMFSVVKDEIHIHVIEYEDDDILSDNTIVLKTSVFLHDFVKEMASVLQRYGFWGYRTEWDSEFPLSLFLKIKDIASGANNLSLSVIIPQAENNGIEAKGSDFSLECDILKGI